MIPSVIYKDIEACSLSLSEREAEMRLSVPRGFDVGFADDIKKELLSHISCKMAAIKVPVSICGDLVDLGFCRVESENLAYALASSREAFVFAITLGMGVDRLLARLSKTTVSALFIADAYASAYAEAAADRAQEILDSISKTKKRFSPGYGDLPLDIQPRILSALNADRLLGITLTDGLLMKPQKSVTAIVGTENEN